LLVILTHSLLPESGWTLVKGFPALYRLHQIPAHLLWLCVLFLYVLLKQEERLYSPSSNLRYLDGVNQLCETEESSTPMGIKDFVQKGRCNIRIGERKEAL
jgi:hypothetical protein